MTRARRATERPRQLESAHPDRRQLAADALPGAASRLLARLFRAAVLSMLPVMLPVMLLGPLLGGSPGLAQKKSAKKPGVAAKSPPDAALNDYIARVRAENAQRTTTPGSIWTENGRMTRLVDDLKASHVHDPISIVVSESLTASTDGTVKNTRASNASSSVSSLLGARAGGNVLNNLLNQTSASGLNAQGQSVTDSSLSTTVGGEVVDVLPNGMLVIQAVRQLAFNQQTQLIRLRGLVRPDDVSAQNQVLSTTITDLELEVVGKGIINDYTYRQNPLVRFLQKILIF